jgi:hypothetical protein
MDCLLEIPRSFLLYDKESVKIPQQLSGNFPVFWIISLDSPQKSPISQPWSIWHENCFSIGNRDFGHTF